MASLKTSLNTPNSSSPSAKPLGDGTHDLSGTISKIRQFDSGWSIATLDIAEKYQVSLTGDMPQVVEGMKVRVRATEVNHPKYGIQYKVSSVEELGFTSEEGIVRYLAGDDFFGVGIETAKAIVAHFGIETLQKLDENPENVHDVPGISANRKKAVVENWETARAAHKGLTELLMLGVSASLAKRIERYYGAKTIDIVKNFPYDLVKVPGVGFKTADEIALRMGVGRESQVRVKACILYVLGESEREGHCFLYHAPLKNKIIDELREDILPGKIVDALEILDKENSIIIEDSRIYSTTLYNAEREVASMLKSILQYHNTPLFTSVDEMRKDLASLEVLNGIVLAAEQEDALFMALNNRVSIITGGPGTGKAQPLTSKVLTPNGWSPIGNLKKDDEVIHPSGKIIKIKDIFPQGLKQTYTVTLNDRTTTNCCLDHLWTIYRKRDRAEKKPPITVSTENLIFRLSQGQRMRQIYLPSVSNIEFKRTNKISGYIVGALLGDGTLYPNGIRFSNLDCDILERIENELPDDVFLIPVKNTQCEYRISTGKQGNPTNRNSLLQEFRKLELLGCNAFNKRIPQEYLFTSSDVRLAVLHGLMDTDGECGAKGTSCSFSSVSKGLCEDVCFLVQSFGGKATLCVKKGIYKGCTHLSFRVNISLPPEVQPFYCSRKLNRHKPRTKYPPVRMIKSITKSVIEECVCISVDSDDGLYITDNFIPTHNTTVTKALISLFEMKNVKYELCSPTGAAAKRLGNATEEEAQTIHRLLGFGQSGDINSPMFKYNENNTLPTHCVIVDEISMVDVRLFRHLLSALERNVRLVMIGDSDQLPSVGAGNVLSDLISSNAIPVTRLKVVFRQKAGSSIISVAHDILNGVVPTLPTPKQSVGQNCMFVPVSEVNTLAQYIVTLVKNTLPSLGYSPDDIQVLSPMRGKGVGVNDLNPVLQEALNPPDSTKPEIQLGFRILRQGDRVMQIRNDYNKLIFNGEVGRICGITKGDTGLNRVFVKYPDKTEPIEYATEELDDIQLAFVSTIHKCIKKGEFILSEEGYKCIENINIGEKVAVGGNTFMTVLDKIESGVQTIYRLTTKAGYKIDVTDKHPILVYDTVNQNECFKLIKEIDETDKIMIDRTLINTTSKLSSDIAWLLGFTVGDGSYNKSNDDYRIEWSGHINALECFEKIRDIISINYGYDIKIYPKNKTRKDFSNIRACVFSKKIREHLLSLGLDYLTCENKTIPNVIFKESIQNKMAFISGLIDSDGCIDKSGIRIVVKSELLAHAVQILLLNSGVIATVRKDYPDAYCIHIQGPSLQTLKQHLKLLNKEKQFKLGLLNNVGGKTNNDLIPNLSLLEDFLNSIPDVKGIKNKGLNSPKYRKRIGNIIYSLKKGANLNYYHLKQMKDYLEENNIGVPKSILNTISKNYYYDSLLNVDLISEDMTYDLEMENIHSFVCNGFVCHNSQGSEYPAVVLAMHTSHWHMLRRNLFYTGLTRAKKHCIIIGTSDAIARAVNNDAQEMRNTTLKSLMA